MRRTRKAPSAESSQRQGSRLGLLAAIAALALLLVPAAQASAAGTMHVKVEGSGSGEVSSVGGIGAFKNKGGENDATFESFGNAFEGSPPIECETPAPGAGTCETPLVTSEALGGESIALHAIPAAGSEFTGWVVEEGSFPQAGCEVSGPLAEPGENPTFCLPTVPAGGGDIRIAAAFALAVPPAVSEVKPVKGPLIGGNLVEIVGTDLANASKVEFGGTEATIESDSATLIVVKAPAHAVGTVAVTVTTPNGTSPNTAADEYTYVAPPALTEVSPASGPTPGANTVELTGTDLGEAKKVEFGTTPAVILENTPTKIKVKAPVHPAGVVDVTVTTAGGTSALKYTYVAVPAITAISPAKGAAAGGTEVEITGLNLAQASEVKFGTVAVPNAQFEQNTATTIRLKSPPGTGVVDIRVVTVGGTSGLVPADKFTYLPLRAFTVTTAGTGSGSVTCNGGTCAGSYSEGTSVTLAASAGAGSTFAGWSGGGCSGTGGCVVTVNADTAVTATFTKDAPPPPPPAEEKCVVPKLKGLALGKAKSALTKAHCKAGKVSKPKKAKGALVVKSSKPPVGTVLAAGSKVDLKLAPKPKKGKK